MTSNIESLRELAAHQHAAFTRDQLRALGFSGSSVHHHLRRGTWLSLSRNVLAIAGSDDSPKRRLMAGALDAGPDSAVCYGSCCAFFGLHGFELEPVHVVRPRNSKRLTTSLARLHTSTYLPAEHVIIIDGIPLTTPTRLAFDLSGRVHPKKFERIVENMWSRHLVTWKGLDAMHASAPRKGRARMSVLREYLDARGPRYVPMDSSLEMRFNEILALYGYAPLALQRWLGNDVECLGRIDFVDWSARLLIFVDSELYHGSKLDRERDAAQTAALEEAGFTVIRIRDFDIWHNPIVVCDAVRIARQRALTRRAA